MLSGAGCDRKACRLDRIYIVCVCACLCVCAGVCVCVCLCVCVRVRARVETNKHFSTRSKIAILPGKWLGVTSARSSTNAAAGEHDRDLATVRCRLEPGSCKLRRVAIVPKR